MRLDGAEGNVDDYAVLTVKKYASNGKIINSETKSTKYDGNFGFWLEGIKVENCIKIEILDNRGNIIATISFSGIGAIPIGTVIELYSPQDKDRFDGDFYIGEDSKCSFHGIRKTGSDTIILDKYLGSTENVKIPGKIQIHENVYNVYLDECALHGGANTNDIKSLVFSEIDEQKVQTDSAYYMFGSYFTGLNRD